MVFLFILLGVVNDLGPRTFLTCPQVSSKMLVEVEREMAPCKRSDPYRTCHSCKTIAFDHHRLGLPTSVVRSIVVNDLAPVNWGPTF